MAELASPSPCLLLQQTREGTGSRWLRFRRPLEVLRAERLEEVLPGLERASRAAERGLWAAGFLAYEAAPAFDRALAAHPSDGSLPLAWWGIFEAPEEIRLPAPAGPLPAIEWTPALGREEYRRAIGRIRRRIAAGETYQVNFTFPLRGRSEGEPFDFFLALTHAQRAGLGAWVDLGRHALCSASPELFFELAGRRVTTRPMKGTSPRGRTSAEDARRAALLAHSTKDRAENVMIVDMMRSDLGRIARPGSVRVESLFDVETYPTVHQMTSTVSAESDASVAEIFAALFPCASITGAPKVRTTEIIRRLEAGPRGIYTGSIGCIGPGRQARFNVAIRTVSLERSNEGGARATYGTGGGIVWDSEADREYEECRTKALVLTVSRPPFELLETLLWRPRSGFFLLERHLERLLASAAYFSYPAEAAVLEEKLSALATTLPPERHRVRLLLAEDGRARLEASPMPCRGRRPWRLRLDDRPTDSSNPFLFHKTTHRRVYDEALARHPEADDVLLWNERGELTEATRANLALELGGRWWTPPLGSGLLAGTYRAELLARGRLRERMLPVEALAEARRVRLLNSLRGWLRTEIQNLD